MAAFCTLFYVLDEQYVSVHAFLLGFFSLLSLFFSFSPSSPLSLAEFLFTIMLWQISYANSLVEPCAYHYTCNLRFLSGQCSKYNYYTFIWRTFLPISLPIFLPICTIMLGPGVLTITFLAEFLYFGYPVHISLHAFLLFSSFPSPSYFLKLHLHHDVSQFLLTTTLSKRWHSFMSLFSSAHILTLAFLSCRCSKYIFTSVSCLLVFFY